MRIRADRQTDRQTYPQYIIHTHTHTHIHTHTHRTRGGAAGLRRGLQGVWNDLGGWLGLGASQHRLLQAETDVPCWLAPGFDDETCAPVDPYICINIYRWIDR